MDDRPLLVSIHCLVYNHEPFLRQCLDGFVMQQTNFRFEAVVHDDVSTDGSADIIRDYAAKYPDIIKPIFETENQYSKGYGALDHIMINACTGKYIAMCEGDDYWTDPQKLQKQIDFLDSHSDYSMCFHNAIEHWEDNSNEDGLFSNIKDQDYTGKYIFENWIIPTASVVFRREVLTCDYHLRLIENGHFCYGDILWFITAAKLGKLRGMSFCGSVYRRHKNGAVFNTSNIAVFNHYYEIYSIIGGEYREHARRLFFDYGIPMFFHTEDKLLKKIVFRECLKASPIKAVYGFVVYWVKKVLH